MPDQREIKGRIIECATWDEFISNLRVKDGRMLGNRVYRGHADLQWYLSSQWERRFFEDKGKRFDPKGSIKDSFVPPGSYKAACYTEYLKYFKELAVGLPGLKTDLLENENDWQALARHHGLITPLLDWTVSPYKAAFYAFTESILDQNPGYKPEKTSPIMMPLKPVAIWCLNVGYERKELEKDDEFEIITNRKDSFYRQKAQQGIFTRLTHDRFFDIEIYLKDRELLDMLECFIIPGAEAPKALFDLKQMNITYSSLFPDLDGVAKDANLAWFFDLI